MDRETAIEFDKRVELAFKQMGQLIEFAKLRLNDADYRAFGEIWGKAVCELDHGVLEVIYRAHPDLRPEGMTPTIPLGRYGR